MRDEPELGFWWHINPRIAYKKLMLQSYFLAREHFYICDMFVHGPTEKDEVYLHGRGVTIHRKYGSPRYEAGGSVHPKKKNSSNDKIKNKNSRETA